MKNINNFTQWKNGSVDVTFARENTHQKHLAQSGRSTRSAVDIFNTLRVFTKEPIRDQEIKLECMNDGYASSCIYIYPSSTEFSVHVITVNANGRLMYPPVYSPREVQHRLTIRACDNTSFLTDG